MTRHQQINQSSGRVEIGPCVLILGDCLDLLPALSGIDAVITDPPYGMNWDADSRRFSGGETPEDRGRGVAWEPVHGDDQPFDPSPWLDFPRVVLFGCNHFSERLPVGTTLVWIKKMDGAFGTFLSDAELAWMKGGHGVYCFRDTSHYGRGVNYPNLHPTQKTVGVMAWTMDRAKVPAGATVLDPYMGSGTTLIACIRTGRSAIGIERDPIHFQTAVERITRELQQMTLSL